MLVISEILSHLVSKPSETLIWRGFGAWQNGDKHVTNRIEMWQNFRHTPETAQPRCLWGFVFCHIFVPDVTNFVTIVWCIKVFVTFLTDMPFCLCKFVPSLSHLTLLLWQILSPVCHIWLMLWQILSPVWHIWLMLWQILFLVCHIFTNFVPFCPQIVTSEQILSNFLSHFLDFYTFFMHKMYILAFCPIFVTFFVTWDKFCHIFNTSETQ